MSLMGIDIGSSRCKAVVFSETGDVLTEVTETYTPRFPAPSQVETDPEELWQTVVAAIRRAAANTHEPVHVFGLSSHGETFIPVDKEGRAVGAAIMNIDTRAVEEAAWWEQHLGRRRIFELTGMIVHPMYPMTKLRWLQRHEPALFASTARFIGPAEFILLKLGFEPLVAYPLACRFMAFDLHKLEWCHELLEAIGLSSDRLPIPVQSGTIAGKLSRSAAGELGLPQNTVVTVSGHDQPCGAVGMGAISPGMVTSSLGTYECLVAVGHKPCLDDAAMEASLNSYCHAVPGQYITIAYFPSGIMVKWFVDTLCGEEAAAAKKAGMDLFDYLDSIAPDKPTGLYVLPHLIGSSNPHFEPSATGAIIGLTQRTTRGDLYRGILEGLGCELAIVADLLAAAIGSFDTIRCTGGGTRSHLGVQLRATLSGRRLQTLTTPEAVCMGAALLAGVAAGTYRSLTEAVHQTVHVTHTYEPDPAQATVYAILAERYRLLYPALAPLRSRPLPWNGA